MENGNIRDFGETKEDPIDSISNDGSTSRTLKNKIKNSNSSDIISAAAAAVNNTTGNSTTGSTIGAGIGSGPVPDSQLGDAVHGKKNHQQQVDEQQQQGESGQGIQQPKQGEGGLDTTDADATSSKNDNSQNQNQETQAKRKGCDKCGKKFGITGGYSCRCGGTFCAFHRYSDRHDCNFDYREMGADQIRRDNPLVVPEKLRKV